MPRTARGLLPIFGLIAAVGVSVATRGEEARTYIGRFSSDATSLAGVSAEHRTVTIPAPDGLSRVIAKPEDDAAVLEVQGRIGSTTLKIAEGPNAEVLWSPDSDAFFVTEDDGGLVGTYVLTVVGTVNGHIDVRHLSDFVAQTFAHPVRCFDPEPPNVAGVTWLGSSHKLLAVAEIPPPHSNCDSMGTFTAYVIDPWRTEVLSTYDQLSAKRRFRSRMGPELLNANDACARHPRACYIPQLHPELP